MINSGFFQSFKVKQLSVALFLLFSAQFLSGCSSLWGDEGPDYLIGVYVFAGKGRPAAMNRNIQMGKRSIRRERVAIVDSRRIESAEVVENGDGCALELKLDSHGRNRWLLNGVESRGRLAVAEIDGRAVKVFRIVFRDGADYLRIPGPIPRDLAEGVARKSKENYKKLNNKW